MNPAAVINMWSSARIVLAVITLIAVKSPIVTSDSITVQMVQGPAKGFDRDFDTTTIRQLIKSVNSEVDRNNHIDDLYLYGTRLAKDKTLKRLGLLEDDILYAGLSSYIVGGPVHVAEAIAMVLLNSPMIFSELIYVQTPRGPPLKFDVNFETTTILQLTELANSQTDPKFPTTELYLFGERLEKHKTLNEAMLLEEDLVYGAHPVPVGGVVDAVIDVFDRP